MFSLPMFLESLSFEYLLPPLFICFFCSWYFVHCISILTATNWTPFSKNKQSKNNLFDPFVLQILKQMTYLFFFSEKKFNFQTHWLFFGHPEPTIRTLQPKKSGLEESRMERGILNVPALGNLNSSSSLPSLIKRF